MDTLNTILVDDEAQGRVFLEAIIRDQLPDVRLIGTASSVEEGLVLVREKRPDLVLLDIHLRNETGFDLLEQCGEINFHVIFITAHDKYAVRAFRFSAIDYLLKPVIPAELVAAIGRVRDRLQWPGQQNRERIDHLRNKLRTPSAMEEQLTIPVHDGFIIVEVKKVLYCQASNNYTRFIMEDGKQILSSYTLKHYDETLSGQGFFRAHKSFLVNLAHVREYRRGEGGVIMMSNNDQVELARAHKDAFLKIFYR